jgi:uncharacterized protein YgiM (DUF1202 family)
MALLSLVALTALELPARAATVEPRVNLLVRERPSQAARIVDRVPAGKKLMLLGRTADGLWAHVDTTKHDGWVPSEQLKGMVKARKATSADEEEAAPEDEEAAKPLAKRRSVRPEAWVSKSRYHDGEDTKLTVSVNRASIYGRPSASSSEVGILRRGEIVNLVRKSPDKKWILVDIGGGESAWIEAKAVKPGAAKQMDESEIAEATAEKPSKRSARVEEVPVEEPPPPPPKKATKVAKIDEAPAEEAPPAPEPPKKKTRKQLAEEKRAAEADRKAAEDADRKRDDEVAPGMAKRDGEPPPPPVAEEEKPKKRKKGVKVASRGDLTGISDENAVVRSGASHGPNYFGAGVRAGMAIIQDRFTSNGTGQLTNYESQTTALALSLGLGYQRQVHKYVLIGIDAGYAFAGAAGVRYHLNDPATPDPVLGVQSHFIDAGAKGALRFNVVGGLQIGLRLGLHSEINLIQQSSKVPLPSDVILGMAIGLSLDLPAIFMIANRPFGVHVYGGGVVPANRQQTSGLEEGKQSETMGAMLGGSLTYNVFKGLGLEAAYNYGFMATHFVGQGRRNLTITAADRGNAQHLITLGLFYAL